ncbi:MAG: DUF1731 domain-containing protein [Chitinophagaceae bacterium]
MNNKKIIIAGGTGFIGQGLARYFGKENEIVILGRQSGDLHKNLYSSKLLSTNDGYNVRYVRWNSISKDINWMKEINGADLIINLAGKSVNCRYHRKQKKEIIDSRVNTTKAIGEAIRLTKVKPALWINAASATIYKNTIDKPNDENTGIISDLKKDNMPFNVVDSIRHKKNKIINAIRYGKNSDEYKKLDKDFSVEVCRIWEKTFFEELTPGTRKIALRTAITLGEGGVITPYFNLCKLGLGGKHGSGKQMYTWVHIEDVARMIEWLFEKKDAHGIYNCAAPNAVTNTDFMRTMRKTTGHRIGLPAFSWMLEFGAFLIGTETELMLKSRWVIPAKAIKEGFDFKYKNLDDALHDIVNNTARNKYHLF